MKSKINCDALFHLTLAMGSWVICQGHGQHQGHASMMQNPDGSPRLENTMVHDAGHIREHYDGMAEFDETKMSPEELEFHYFKLHDFNNDTKLDGLEILKALTHTLPFEEAPEAGKHARESDPSKRKDIEMTYYTDIVDQVLKEDDINNDGYLTYPEYILARRRQEAKEMAEQRHPPPHPNRVH